MSDDHIDVSLGDHIHANPDRLHFACPACYERSVQDQLDAEVAEATVYEVAVRFTADGRDFGFKLELPWPKSWPPTDVFAYYAYGRTPSNPKLHPTLRAAIDEILADANPRRLAAAIRSARVVDMRPGRAIPIPPAPDPMEGQPTLFG